MLDRPAIHLVSYNIHKGFSSGNRRFTLPAMRDALHALNPDVICLQEVVGRHDRHAESIDSWPSDCQARFLANPVFPFVAYGPNAHYPAGHHGNAVMSRFPILFQQNVDLSLHPLERRGLLHVVLQPRDEAKPLHIACTHLNLRARDRRQQLRRIREYLEAEVPVDQPLILAGDFNDWRRHAHTVLPADWHEVFRSVRGMPARTYPGWLPMLRLDRVYVRHLRPISADRLWSRPWTRLSDHGPLSVRLAGAMTRVAVEESTTHSLGLSTRNAFDPRCEAAGERPEVSEVA